MYSIFSLYHFIAHYTLYCSCIAAHNFKLFYLIINISFYLKYFTNPYIYENLSTYIFDSMRVNNYTHIYIYIYIYIYI